MHWTERYSQNFRTGSITYKFTNNTTKWEVLQQGETHTQLYLRICVVTATYSNYGNIKLNKGGILMNLHNLQTQIFCSCRPNTVEQTSRSAATNHMSFKQFKRRPARHVLVQCWDHSALRLTVELAPRKFTYLLTHTHFWFSWPIFASVRVQSHRHECESEYPYTGSKKHQSACIPMAAVHIDTSSVCSVRVTCEFHSYEQFLCRPCFYPTSMKWSTQNLY